MVEVDHTPHWQPEKVITTYLNGSRTLTRNYDVAALMLKIMRTDRPEVIKQHPPNDMLLLLFPPPTYPLLNCQLSPAIDLNGGGLFLLNLLLLPLRVMNIGPIG